MPIAEVRAARLELNSQVLLTAPAGGGKTFVAIARAAEALDRGGHVLFAARAKALALFFCKWFAACVHTTDSSMSIALVGSRCGSRPRAAATP